MVTSDATLVTDKIKDCPTCGKKIKAVAENCPTCGASFEVHNRAYCTHCHAIIQATPEGKCPQCTKSNLLDQRLYSRMTAPGTPPVAAPEKKAKVSVPAEPVSPGDSKKCPVCAEMIKAEARLCRFCGARFEVNVIDGKVESRVLSNPVPPILPTPVTSKLLTGEISNLPKSQPVVPPVSVPIAGSLQFAVSPATTPGMAGFVPSISAQKKEKMPLWQLYISPKGRIGRLTFFLKGMLPWWGLMILCYIVIILGTESVNTSNTSDAGSIFFSILMVILSLGMLFLCWVWLMLMTKRYHDLGRSGWNILMWLIPLVGQFIYIFDMIQLFFFKGNEGPNKYGDYAS